MAGGRFSIEAVFTANDRFSGILGRIGANVGKFASGARAQLASVSNGAFTGLRTAAVVGTGAAVAMGGALYNVVGAGAELEHTLVGAAAKFSPAFRKGTAEFKELRAAAEKIGSTTEFSSNQAGAALKDLGAAGLNLGQAIAILPGLVDLGTAAEIELAEASTIATKSLGAFNLKTEDTVQLTANMNRVMDTMARTADLTTADMGGLFETIQEGGPVAVAAGASIETFLAMAGQLSQAGIDGSVAGTTLKNVFLSLAAPSTEAAAALQKLGIKTKDAKGNLRDVVDVLGDLEKGTAKMGTADRAATLEQIFGKIPIAGVTSLLSAGTDKIRTMRTELENAGGSMKKMAGIMRDDTKGDIDRLGKAFDAVKIAIFGVVQGPITPMIQGLTELARANKDVVASKLTAFLKDARDFGAGFAKVFGQSIGPIRDAATWLGHFVSAGKDAGSALRLGEGAARLAVGLGTMVLALKAVTVATAAWNGVMAINPMAALVLGVAALLGVYVAFKPEIDAFIGRHRTAFTVLGAGVALIGGAIVAMKLWRAAVLAHTVAWMGWTIATNSATGAMVASKVAAMSANAALLPLIATLGAAAAAVGALMVAWNQWQDLQAAAGGHVWEGVKGVFNGKGFFGAIDEKMNEDARREAQGGVATAAAAPGSLGAPAPVPAVNAPGLGSDVAPAGGGFGPLGLPAALDAARPSAGAAPVLADVAGAATAGGADSAQLAELIAVLKAQVQGGKSVVELRLPPGVQADVKAPQGGARQPIKVKSSGSFNSGS